MLQPPPLPPIPPPLPLRNDGPPPLPADLPIDSTIPLPPPLPRRGLLRRRRDPEQIAPPVNPIVVIIRSIGSAFTWMFGFASLFIGLATLAALPILQFLSLGYLLEAGARVARSGRLRDGFVGVRQAGRVGGLIAGIWLCILPARFVSGMAHSAEIIDPGSSLVQSWRFGLMVLLIATAVHIAFACAMGGKLRHFFYPFHFVHVIGRVFRGGYYARCRDSVWEFVTGLRLPHYFWLGARGFICAFAWLFIPVSLLALGHANSPVAPVIGFVGGAMLAIVLLYLPFLQMRMAAENRLRAGFQWMEARREYRRAPWAFAFSFVVTLVFAVPLYLFKIEIVPKEAAWLPGLVFMSFIFPARLLTGWALGRARKRLEPRHWFFRWTGRMPFIPFATTYVIIVFFTQYTSWNGVWSLYEQHAFLVPVPFFGM